MSPHPNAATALDAERAAHELHPLPRHDARARAHTDVARISSDSLLLGGTEVHIEHRGSLYRLKQTSLGKLILTK